MIPLFTTQQTFLPFGCPLPEKLNKLQRGHIITGNANISSAIANANFGSEWDLYNLTFNGGANTDTATFGALTTAPDGTNTGRKVVEGTNNGIHAIECVSLTLNGSDPFSNERMAFILKAAERTRVALTVSTLNGGAAGSGVAGVTTVFDLANGQIGVAGTVFGTIPDQDPFAIGYRWHTYSDSITPLGNGWYRCSMDFSPGWVLGIGMMVTMFVDNASGTAAKSTSYVGDGTSGVYVWRSNMLPARSYNMTRRTFYDDFSSLSGFDLTNSKAAGFNWYLNNAFGHFSVVPTSPSTLSIVTHEDSSSVLQISTAPAPLSISSIVSLGNPGETAAYIGTVYQVPMLMEARVSWNYIMATQPTSTSAFWTVDVETLMQSFNTHPKTIYEMDYYENVTSGLYAIRPKSTHFFSTSTSPGVYTADTVSLVFTHPAPAPGPAAGPGNQGTHDVWDDAIIYINNTGYTTSVDHFFFQPNSTYYSCIQSHPEPNHPPDISPTFWTAVVAPSPSLNIDWDDFHVFSQLHIPYISADDFGQVVIFLDGRMVGGFMYGPDSLPPNHSTTWNTSDARHWPILIGGGNYPTFFDWVSVYQ